MAAELGHPQGVTTTAGPGSARQAINEMLDAGLLDALMDRVDAGELTLTGQGGFLPEMVKAVLERGLAAELSEHLGYEKGDPAGRGPDVDVVGDRAAARLGRDRPRWVRGAERVGAVDRRRHGRRCRLLRLER